MIFNRLPARMRAISSALCALTLALAATVSAARAESQIKQIKIQVRAGEADVLKIADLQKIAPDFDGTNFVLTTSDAPSLDLDAKAIQFRPIPAQADDIDGDGKPDEIAFTVEPNTRQTRIVTLNYGPESAIAPLRVPWPKRAHAAFAKKYEGMGWESDRFSWRIYFDKRNVIDLYGKKTHGLSLDYFAAPAVNYHAESPIGRDIFANGATLGVGSIGAVVDGQLVHVSEVDKRSWRVIADGPVRAIAELKYEGWKVGGKSIDITSRLTVWAGQHWFEHRIYAKNADGLELVTGLPKKPDVEVMLSPQPRNGKAYLATWGKQVVQAGTVTGPPVPGENLGLAILEPAGKQPASPANDADTLLDVPLDKNGEGRFLVVSAWDQEQPDDAPPFGVSFDPAHMIPGALQSATAWEKFVDAIPVGLPVPRILPKKAEPAPPPADATDKDAKRKTYSEAIALMQADIDRVATEIAPKAKAGNTTLFPSSRDNDTGKWAMQKGVGWTGTFWVAELWLLYNRTHDQKYADWARFWEDSTLGQESRQSHDTGFINYYGSARSFDATTDARYKESALRAADRLQKLYNPKTQLVAAWGVGGEDTIIDTMLNLQILWWASAQTKDPSFRETGHTHALKAAEWLVRPDGSVAQSVHYDPVSGRERFTHTHQGFGDNTSWGRGTAWGLYGFALAAQATDDPKLLETAEKIASFVLARTPDDDITWHDYMDEGVYFRNKDTSGAAIAADGLLLLSRLEKSDSAKADTYRKAGVRIVDTLIDHYLTPTGPNDTATPPGVLRHGSGARPDDHGLIFGDYYLLEALISLDAQGIKRG